MTQPHSKDERLLDYLYGELEGDERAAFEAQLSGDARLRAEVDSFAQLRQDLCRLPAPEQSAESVQRMTALLMQQAAQAAPAVAGRPESASPTATGDGKTESAGGAKVLPLRPRGLRRVLQSPASGIFAAAAAALFWVVVRSPSPVAPPSPLPPSPSVAVTATAPTGSMSPPAVLPVPAPPQAVAAAAPPAPEGLAASAGADQKSPAAPSLKDAFAVNLAKPTAGRAAYGKADSAQREGYRSGGAELDRLAGATAGAPAADPPRSLVASNESKKGVSAGESLLGALADARSERRFAEPPPPPVQAGGDAEEKPPDSLRNQIAQAQNQRRERVVDELANQELAGMPSGAAAPSAAPLAASPAAEPATSRYAQRQAATNSSSTADDSAALPNNRDGNSQGAFGAGPRRVASLANVGDTDSKDSTLLTTAQEQLRQGRCGEADQTLKRLEQLGMAGNLAAVAETRREWLRSCSSPSAGPSQNQGTNNLERQQLAPPSSPPGLSRLPSPAPKSAVMRAKKAAPPAKAKAADGAY